MSQSKDIAQADITWLEDGTPYCEHFQDIYFSTADGVAEAEYVFLKHNQFPQRFTYKQSLTIGETGFGTGLNFLVTAFHWLKQTECFFTTPSLKYISVEKYPLSRQQLHRVYQFFKQRWPDLSDLCNRLLSQYPGEIQSLGLSASPVEIKLSGQGQMTLVLCLGDAAKRLESLTSEYQRDIDAWYLDGFAPTKNQSMWTSELFTQIARLSHTDTTLSTFTSAGDVRRGLINAGFNIKKAKGFGIKREMLYGAFTG